MTAHIVSPCSRNACQRHKWRPIRLDAVRGYLLAELAAVMAISALLVIWKAPQQVRGAEDAGMDGVAVYMQVLNTAVEKYDLANHNALANGQSVPGFAVPMAPTIEELRAAKYLASPSFPTTITHQAIPVGIKIVAQNCPGVNCQIFGQSYATQPLTFGKPNVRYDLIARYLQSAGGAASAAQDKSPDTLRSTSGINFANPLGAVPGIIGIGTYLDEGLYQRFVQIQDTRDPDLQGNLSVAGNMSIGGSSQFGGPVIANSSVTANGPVSVNSSVTTTGPVDVNNCIKLQPDGRAGFNCLDPNDLPAGWGGGVRAWDVLATGALAESESAATFGVGSGKWSFMSRDAKEAVIGTNGRIFGDRLIPTGAYAPGTACNDAGAVARSSDAGAGGLLVVCSGATWAPLITITALGSACSVSSAAAVTTAGVALVCADGYWMAATDRMGKWAVQDSEVVMNGSLIGKPGCGSGGTPRIFSIPQAIDTSGNASNFTATDQGPYWSINLTSGTGAAAGGQSLAQSGCWYP